MTKRGKVLRDTSAGPGLLSIDGNQHQFTLEGIWKSPDPPKPGMHVLIEFAPDLTIQSVIPIPESQVAKEQAEAVMNAAKEKGGVLVSAAVARFGLPLLVATGALLIAWFFLPAVSIQGMFGKESLTFWQVLGFVNGGNSMESLIQGRNGPSAGFYGFLAFVALAGPFLRFFWKDKRAALSALLPVVFMLFVAIMVRSTLHSAMGGTPDGPFAEVQRQAQEEMMRAISIGFGTYLGLLASLYLGAVGLKDFLLGRAAVSEVPQAPRQAAA